MAARSRKPPAADSTDRTREVLVRVALERFGTNGFDATSTREISKLAGANIAAIAYHFGGKEGLRTSCAEYVAALIGRTLGPALGGAPADRARGPDEALAQLLRAFEAMIDFAVVSPEAEPIARFMLREMTHPSPAFDLIHDGAMAPMHESSAHPLGAGDRGRRGERSNATIDACDLRTGALFPHRPSRRPASHGLARYRSAASRRHQAGAPAQSQRVDRSRTEGTAVILESLCAFRLLAALLTACAPASPAFGGYVEGEYVQIAPIDIARITSLAVRRGDFVKAGDAIAGVETTDAISPCATQRARLLRRKRNSPISFTAADPRKSPRSWRN